MKRFKSNSTRIQSSNHNLKLLHSKRSTRVLILNNHEKIAKSKRSQEEMIGFVLIVVLVAVIGLVFFAISIRKPGTTEDKESENFLYSSMLYTTSCYKSQEIVYSLQDLIKACYNNEKCFDERQSCNVLNETLTELIDKSFSFGNGSIRKAYLFKIYAQGNVFFSSAKGSPTKISRLANIPIYSGRENIHVEMSVFY